MSDLEEILESRYGEIEGLLSELTAREKEPLLKHPTVPTLKATLFLLFYNLVESVIYKSFEMIFDSIAENCDSFNKLNPYVKNSTKDMISNLL